MYLVCTLFKVLKVQSLNESLNLISLSVSFLINIYPITSGVGPHLTEIVITLDFQTETFLSMFDFAAIIIWLILVKRMKYFRDPP